MVVPFPEELKEKTTIFCVIYNTPPELLRRWYLKHKDLGVKLKMIDDGSDNEETLKRLKKLERKCSVEYLGKNYGLPQNMVPALELIETEYVIRVDSDDYIEGISDVEDKGRNLSEIDLIINSKVGSTIKSHFRHYRTYHGSLMKTNLLKKVYKFIDNKNLPFSFFNEDQLVFFLVLYEVEKPIPRFKDTFPRRTFLENSVSSKKRDIKSLMRYNSFLHFCEITNNYDLYYKIVQDYELKKK